MMVEAVLAQIRQLNREALLCCVELAHRTPPAPNRDLWRGLTSEALERLAGIPTLLTRFPFTGASKTLPGSECPPLGPFNAEASIQMLTEVSMHLSRWANDAPALAALFFGVAPSELQGLAQLGFAERREWIQFSGPRMRLRWDDDLWRSLLTASNLDAFHRVTRHGLAILGAELFHSLQGVPITLRPPRQMVPQDPELYYQLRIALRDCMWRHAVPRSTIARLTLFSRGQLDHAHRHHRTPLPRAPSGNAPSNVYEQLLRCPKNRQAAALVAVVITLVDAFIGPRSPSPHDFQAVIDTWTTYEAAVVWSPWHSLSFGQYELLLAALRSGELQLADCERCGAVVLKHASLLKRVCEMCR